MSLVAARRGVAYPFRARPARYGLAWGVEIRAVTEHFKAEVAGSQWNRLTVVIGCVDNADAPDRVRLRLHFAEWR